MTHCRYFYTIQKGNHSDTLIPRVVGGRRPLPSDAGLSAAAETLVGILKRVIVSPAVYPRFLEIAELARSLCRS